MLELKNWRQFSSAVKIYDPEALKGGEFWGPKILQASIWQQEPYILVKYYSTK